jgi:predicted regulator of Ras-like GTPase activity (Roadblock/LC7/MglB family)
MLREKITGFIDELRTIDGITACALVSRDGIMIGKHFDTDLNEPWFAAMSATLLASAESAASIIRMKSPDSVTIHAEDAVIIVMGAGEKLLVAAIIRKDADRDAVHRKMQGIARKIAEAL